VQLSDAADGALHNTLAAALLLTGTTRQITDQIRYTYDTGSEGTGWLTRIDGLLPSDVFRYGYTPKGEVAVTHLVRAPRLSWRPMVGSLEHPEADYKSPLGNVAKHPP
jgi:hypothetical protein